MTGGTVYTSTSTNRSASRGAKKVYHTDQDCDLLKQANQTSPRPRDGLADGWRECQKCAGEMPQTGEATVIDCPWCGRPCKDLPGHMRGCSP